MTNTEKKDKGKTYVPDCCAPKCDHDQHDDRYEFVEIIMGLCQQNSRAAAEIGCSNCYSKVLNIAHVGYFYYFGTLWVTFNPASDECLVIKEFNNGELINTQPIKDELQLPASRICSYECGAVELSTCTRHKSRCM